MATTFLFCIYCTLHNVSLNVLNFFLFLTIVSLHIQIGKVAPNKEKETENYGHDMIVPQQIFFFCFSLWMWFVLM